MVPPAGAVSLQDAPADAELGSRRAEVLALLQASEDALTVDEIARATGLHVNTARFHLDALVEQGRAERSSEPRETPGRPRILYRARGELAGPRSFGLLAEMLTGLVSALSAQPGPAAAEAGRAWGAQLVERPSPQEQVSASEATRRLNDLLDSVGFAPEVGRTGSNVEIRLHHCPFREVAERHTDVVCALHLGLMQGALEELRAPLEPESLEPLVTRSLCLAKLRSTSRKRRRAKP